MRDVPPPSGPLRADQPAPPRGPLATEHENHDRYLVAAHAWGDLEPGDRARAAELLAGCAACAALAADLRALAAATAELPRPRRPRDYTLSRADAARLRPSGWRRLLAALASPRSIASPLAASLSTLGVAGLLIATLVSGGSAAILAPVGRSLEPGAVQAPAAELHSTAGPDTAAEPDRAATPAPVRAPGSPLGRNDGESGGPMAAGAHDNPTDADGGADRLAADAGEGPPLLAIGSVVLLVAGLTLFLLRRLAIRSGFR